MKVFKLFCPAAKDSRVIIIGRLSEVLMYSKKLLLIAIARPVIAAIKVINLVELRLPSKSSKKPAFFRLLILFVIIRVAN